MNKEYTKFKQFLTEENYGDAALYLIENPIVKEFMHEHEFRIMLNYYENYFTDFVIEQLKEVNNGVTQLSSKLEKTLEKLNSADEGGN